MKTLLASKHYYAWVVSPNTIGLQLKAPCSVREFNVINGLFEQWPKDTKPTKYDEPQFFLPKQPTKEQVDALVGALGYDAVKAIFGL